jgi:hypothetical protein
MVGSVTNRDKVGQVRINLIGRVIRFE